MACTLTDFTPAQLLSILVGPPSLGRIGPDEIQADIDSNGDDSQRAKAKSDFARIADLCGLDLGSVDTGTDEGAALCQNINLGLRWYTLYRYKALDIDTRPKGQCGEDDYRIKEKAWQRACEALRAAGGEGACMATRLEGEITGVECVPYGSAYGCILVTDIDC